MPLSLNRNEEHTPLMHFMFNFYFSDSEVIIFLADLKIPYFKPKVNLSKELFP